MRYVALALILLTLPAFILFLKGGIPRRNLALCAIGALLFFGGSLKIEAAFIAMPAWRGTVQGLQISPVDTLALALIFTRRSSIIQLPFILLFALYALPLFASLGFASVPLATLFSCFQFVRGIILFSAIAGELARPGALRSLVTGLAIGLLIQSGYVAYQKASGMVQATGSIVHQNTLGVMAELALIPVIAALLEGERSKIVALGALGGLIIIAGGGSRGAMGVAGVSVAALILLSVARNMSSRKMVMLGLSALTLAVVVPLGMGTLKERFGNTSITAEEDQRAAFERSARAISADYPFGVGANLFVNVSNMQGYAGRAGVAWNFTNRSAPVHNAFLLARAETGRAGEAMLVLLILAPALLGLRFAFKNRRSMDGAVALGSSIILIGVMYHSTYEFAIHVYNPQMLLIANIAIISGVIFRQKMAKGQAESGSLASNAQRSIRPDADAHGCHSP
jgi:hypothetical protein